MLLASAGHHAGARASSSPLSPTPWPSVHLRELRGEHRPEEDADALERNMVRAFAAGRYERALEIIDDYLGRWPETPHMHYNRACAFANLGRPDAAGAALLAAVEHGFRDFETMKHDPDLASMRDHEVFTAILEARERVDRTGMDRRLDSWKRKLGDEYVYETDEQRRLQIATGLGRRAHAEMKEMISRLADEQSRTLFPEVPLDWCLVIVPSSEDTPAVFKEQLGVDDPNRTPGVYQHGKRMLVSRDIGSSMRHEFTHRMHWADMDRRRQRHAMWVQEGLAGLYEDYRFRPDGSIEFIPNIRHNIARRQVTANMDLSFEKLFRLESDAFLAGNARYYPQVRSLFEFLADVGMLETWYRTYCDTWEIDPTGGKAWEKVFGRPLDDVNERWRRWVLGRGQIDDRVDHGDGSIGITGEEAGDGVRVVSVVGTQARRGGLRVGDVILKVDGEAVRSRAELMMAIAAREVGDVVRLEIRRGRGVKIVIVRLEPLKAAIRDA